MTNKVPSVGDMIYVPTAMYLSRGRDDFNGGLCEVSKVGHMISDGKTVPSVCIKERPGTTYNWKFLSEKQETLMKRWGEERGFEDPDYDERFNEP